MSGMIVEKGKPEVQHWKTAKGQYFQTRLGAKFDHLSTSQLTPTTALSTGLVQSYLNVSIGGSHLLQITEFSG